MSTSRKPNLSFLLSVLLTLVFSACSGASVLPGPESASGVYVDTGFEYYSWDTGLRLMIWIDGIKDSGCNITSDEWTYDMRCYSVGDNNVRFDWHLSTPDGANANFYINDWVYDLAEGNVFILTVIDGEASVKQLKRDLSELPAYADRVTEFGLADPDIKELLQVSVALEDCISSKPPSEALQIGNVETAHEVLLAFFNLLHAGEYGRAAAYYGGDYEGLRNHNPSIAPDDYPALFQNACTVNGAQCLRIRRATFQERPSNTEFRFVVIFNNDDGSIFSRGPCCGDDNLNGERQDEFLYTVRIECTRRYVVMELPVYLP